MKKYIFQILLLTINSTILFSQVQPESESIFYKKSLTLFLRNISFEGGMGGTFWFNNKYSLLLIFNVSAERQYTGYSSNSDTKMNIFINPIITFKRHIFEKDNVTPYLGLTIQPTWYLGELTKRTDFIYGITVGVESWITEYITITGEQAYLNRITINTPVSTSDMYGRSSIAMSFYF